MNCRECGAELNPEASFCHACGAKVGGAPSPPPVPVASEPHHDEGRSAGLRSLAGRRDEPEAELWSGGYSPKAMYGTFLLVAVLSIVLIVAGIMLMGQYAIALWIALGLMALAWLWALAVLAVRRFGISYRLTTQRFFHQSGILTRTTDRIEVIEMDDVTYTQGIIQRMLNVGTIRITSSDKTHPELIMQGIADVQHVSELIDTARRKELNRRGLRIESV